MKTAFRLIVAIGSVLGALAVTVLSVNAQVLHKSKLPIYFIVVGAWSFLIVFGWLLTRIIVAGLRVRSRQPLGNGPSR